MGDYQRVKQTKYILGRVVYNKTLWIIRDYYRIKDIADSFLERTPDPRQPRVPSNKISDITYEVAQKRERYLKEINIIDKCIAAIPEEYRKGVWDNIMKDKPYPRYADRSTYGRWKSKFIYDVAKMLEFI